MSLSDELDALGTAPTCRTCVWYKDQPEDIKTKFCFALERGVSKSALREVCIKHGLNISSKAFREHLANHHVGG